MQAGLDGVGVVRPLHRHRDHTEHGLEQTDSYAAVTLPKIHHGDTSAVVGVVHAQVVLFAESFRHRQHPVQSG